MATKAKSKIETYKSAAGLKRHEKGESKKTAKDEKKMGEKHVKTSPKDAFMVMINKKKKK